MGALARPAARSGRPPTSSTASRSRSSGWRCLAVGILAIPYPGPGWAIVFLGLGILATEFDWARRLLALRQGALRQGDGLVQPPGPRGCRRLGAAFTAAVVVATLWLLGALGWAAELGRSRHGPG